MIQATTKVAHGAAIVQRDANFATIRGHTVFVRPLTRDSVILDLGASRGDFANELSERYGGAFYLVEANPVLVEELRVKSRFPVWQCAVYSADQLVPFHIAENSEGSSILNLPETSIYNSVLQQTIEVQAKKLETLMAEMGACRIDLVKMDIEGTEVAVLGSLPEVTLCRLGQISVEFHGDPVFGFHLEREVEEVILYLQRCGFLCLDFSSAGPRRDVLFINRSLHSVPWLQGIIWKLQADCLSRLRENVPPSLKAKLRRPLEWATGIRTRRQ